MSSSANNTINNKPVVLCFSGHDPSGGAGIQADIEAIAAQGAHAATIITALTCQDTTKVQSFYACDSSQIQQQAERLLADMSIAAIKIGMTADSTVVMAIHKILKLQPEIPVVLDPVLASGGGDSLASDALIEALNHYIMPYCEIITPNIPELYRLAGKYTETGPAAEQLLKQGCRYVLATGTHQQSSAIEHQLFSHQQARQTYQHQRLSGEYHGSGCTLASAIAGQIALGQNTIAAVETAIDYSLKTLINAHSPGKGQALPNRLFALNQQN